MPYTSACAHRFAADLLLFATARSLKRGGEARGEPNQHHQENKSRIRVVQWRRERLDLSDALMLCHARVTFCVRVQAVVAAVRFARVFLEAEFALLLGQRALDVAIGARNGRAERQEDETAPHAWRRCLDLLQRGA